MAVFQDGAGNGHALLFTAGEPRRTMRFAFRQPEPCEDFARSVLCVAIVVSCNDLGNHDVF